MKLAGFQIYTSLYLTERVQHSRSPARAKRRAAKGYAQHFAEVPKKDIFIDYRNSSIICHPTMLNEIRKIASSKVTQ